LSRTKYRVWKKDLPIFLRPWRTIHPSCRTAAGVGPAQPPLGSSSLRAIPDVCGLGSSPPLLAASLLDADELSIFRATPSQLLPRRKSSGRPSCNSSHRPLDKEVECAGGGSGNPRHVRPADCGQRPESGERRRRGERAAGRGRQRGAEAAWMSSNYCCDL